MSGFSAPYAGAVKLAPELGNDINAVADFGDTSVVGEPFKLFTSYPENLEQFPESALGDMRWSGSTAFHGVLQHVVRLCGVHRTIAATLGAAITVARSLDTRGYVCY
jgi:hypothetical protein